MIQQLPLPISAGGTNKVVNSITNFFSTTGYTAPLISSITGCKVLAVGATTAAVLKTVISITGAGSFQALGVSAVDATSRTIRAKLTLDGVVVFDSTTNAVTALNRGLAIVGAFNGTAADTPNLGECMFNTTALLEVASSNTEATGIQVVTIYDTRT